MSHTVVYYASLNGRLYCTPKALWKLRWFLRDVGYDPELVGRGEVDDKVLMGLRGIVRISRSTLNGRSFLNLGGLPGGVLGLVHISRIKAAAKMDRNAPLAFSWATTI
jgi:hypothetical protein